MPLVALSDFDWSEVVISLPQACGPRLRTGLGPRYGTNSTTVVQVRQRPALQQPETERAASHRLGTFGPEDGHLNRFAALGSGVLLVTPSDRQAVNGNEIIIHDGVVTAGRALYAVAALHEGCQQLLKIMALKSETVVSSVCWSAHSYLTYLISAYCNRVCSPPVEAG